MPIEFVGGSVSLTANGSGDIKLSFARDGKIVQFLVNSTGRCEIVKIEQEGVEVYTTGTLEIAQFKEHGNTYKLPEALEYKSGQSFIVSLKDLSGSANLVYFVFVIVY
jgi:hypothetical protein